MAKTEPKSDLERQIEAAADLREQIREAHETLQTLKAERVSLRTELGELRKVRESWLNPKDLEKQLIELGKQRIDIVMDQILEALNLAEAKALERFDAVVAICLGEDPEGIKQGKQTVYALMRRYVASTQLPIRVTEETHITMSRDTAGLDQQMTLHSSGIKKFFGLNFDYTYAGLPVVYDSRIPLGIVYLVLPPVTESDTRVVHELDIRTGVGAPEALKALEDQGRRRYQAQRAALAKVPAAFRRKA